VDRGWLVERGHRDEARFGQSVLVTSDRGDPLAGCEAAERLPPTARVEAMNAGCGQLRPVLEAHAHDLPAVVDMGLPNRPRHDDARPLVKGEDKISGC